jgi:hypothetical protein
MTGRWFAMSACAATAVTLPADVHELDQVGRY